MRVLGQRLDARPNPIRARRFAESPRGKPVDRGGNVGLVGFEVLAVQTEEDVRRHESDALVPVDIAMVLRKPERLRRGEHCQINGLAIRPLLLRPCQRGFEQAVIANVRPASVFAELCVMRDVEQPARQPFRRPAPWH